MECIFRANFSVQDKHMKIMLGADQKVGEKFLERRKMMLYSYSYLKFMISHYITHQHLIVNMKHFDERQSIISDLWESLLPEFMMKNKYGKIQEDAKIFKINEKNPETDRIEFEFNITLYISCRNKRYIYIFNHRTSVPANNQRSGIDLGLLSHVEINSQNCQSFEQCNTRTLINHRHIRLLLTEIANLLITKSPLKDNTTDSLLVNTLNKGLSITTCEMYYVTCLRVNQSYTRLVTAMLKKRVRLYGSSDVSFILSCSYASSEYVWPLLQKYLNIDSVINKKCHALLESLVQCVFQHMIYKIWFEPEMRLFSLHIKNLLKYGASMRSTLILQYLPLLLKMAQCDYFDVRELLAIDLFVALLTAGFTLKRHGKFIKDTFVNAILLKIAYVKKWKSLMLFLYYHLGIDFTANNLDIALPPDMCEVLETLGVRTLKQMSAQVIRQNLFPNALYSVTKLPICTKAVWYIVKERPYRMIYDINLHRKLEKLIIAEDYFEYKLKLFEFL